MPNDISLAENGDIYISDSGGNSIFKIAGGKAEVWLNGPAISAPNGICIVKGRLIIGTNGDGCLKSVDLSTKTVSTLVNLGPGTIDGIAADREGLLLVSHNEGRLFRVSLDGQAAKILDTTPQRMNLADFACDQHGRAHVEPVDVGHVIVHVLPQQQYNLPCSVVQRELEPCREAGRAHQLATYGDCLAYSFDADITHRRG